MSKKVIPFFTILQINEAISCDNNVRKITKQCVSDIYDITLYIAVFALMQNIQILYNQRRNNIAKIC